MRELINDILKWRGDGKRIALAMVIKAWGSAPRPVGSHMIISDRGEMVGSVSGGCVETAVVEEAQKVIAAQKPKRLKYGVTNEEAWSVGLACGGQIEILVQPCSPDDSFYQRLFEAIRQNQTAIAVTNIGDAAAKKNLLIKDDEKTVLNLDAENPPREAFLLENDDGVFFVEPYLPPLRLIVIGGVHIAIPLTKFAAELEYEVYLIDPRTAFANPDRFPHVRHILNQWPQDALPELKIDQNTFVVLLTHDPKIDDPALKSALAASPAYVGVLGSKRTHEKRVKRLRDAGITESQIAQLHAPVGLKIGAKSTAEIALSILAQMTAVRRGAA